MPTQFNFKGEAVDTSMRVTRSDQLIFQFFLIVPQTSFFNAPLPFSLSALHFLSNLSSWNYQTNHIAGLSPAMPQLFWSVWRDAAGATRTPERICGCKGAEKRCRQSSNNWQSNRRLKAFPFPRTRFNVNCLAVFSVFSLSLFYLEGGRQLSGRTSASFREVEWIAECSEKFVGVAI